MKLCLCSHPDLEHPGNECVRAACGCIRFREDTAATQDCRQPCDADCPFGRAHCWNWHRPEGEPDWHHPARCDEANKDAAAGTEGAA